ncbi:FAD-binding protein [Primorskyibacter sp. S187A]|uniref:FAD-binding protein n=1 Tax=Primorskyibacter sp. S187A TaxID=3415130 RepID=UPI003C7EC655
MTPQTEAELADIVLSASGPLRVIGGDTRRIGTQGAATPVHTGGLSGITLYEPGALTMVAQAGTPLAEIEAALGAENQRLAFEPGDWRQVLGTTGTPTIGGIVSANVSGPRRIQTGACRDHMLGVRFVDGAGSIIKNGGRVMKNVTGYDLVKLMTGAWGTMGILTEVSFKVLAKPQTERTLALAGLDADSAVQKLSAALGSPFDVTGAAHADAGTLADGALTLVRIEGLSESVAYRSEQLTDTLLPGCEIHEDDASAALWQHMRDVTPMAGPGALWRVSVKPSDGPRLTEMLRAEGHAISCLYDWGGGLVWVRFEGNDLAQAQAVRRATQSLGGHATLMRGSAELKEAVPIFEPENPVVAKISAGLRAQFDPRGLLNPGLMG